MGSRVLALLVGLTLMLSVAVSPVAARDGHYSNAARVAVESLAAEFSAADVAGAIVTDEYTSAHNGVTHVYLRQQIGGRAVHGAEATVNVQKGAVVYSGNTFVADLAGNVSGVRKVQVSQALEAAVAAVESHAGAARGAPELIYQAMGDGTARLAYNVQVVEGDHWWNLAIDAETGGILQQEDFVDHENAAHIAASTARAKDAKKVKTALAKAIVPPEQVEDGSSYNVFPMPLESPLDGPRAVVENPADATASPFGWHDTNGEHGAEHTITRGNNVNAYADTIGAQGVAGRTRPTPSASLTAARAWTSTTRSPATTQPRRSIGTRRSTTCSSGAT